MTNYQVEGVSEYYLFHFILYYLFIKTPHTHTHTFTYSEEFAIIFNHHISFAITDYDNRFVNYQQLHCKQILFGLKTQYLDEKCIEFMYLITIKL